MAKIEKKTLSVTYCKQRNWGWEYWVENLPEYCGKILHIINGCRGSLHFHINKLETMLLNFGKVQLRLIDTETAEEYFVELNPGDSIKIPRGQPHQIIALEESEIIEFSTFHDENDSKRLQKSDQ